MKSLVKLTSKHNNSKATSLIPKFRWISKYEQVCKCKTCRFYLNEPKQYSYSNSLDLMKI